MISDLHIRELTEQREEHLSPRATQSRSSKGRERSEAPCPIRTCFQRDRDRIIHSKAFRRLKHKTQVFIAPQGDHYVTRLTHTLEVSQIARTIARALDLNEDLTEAIALGHDLGHTPFGHIGEEVLNEIAPGGFRHSEQSLRVVDLLENDGEGLNLTWEVRDGILNHSKSTAGVLQDWRKVGTIEGEVVRISDIVAYVNRDIDDAIRAGMITERDLPEAATSLLGTSRSARINSLVGDIIESSWAVHEGTQAEPSVMMSANIMGATETLRQFLFRQVYNVQSVRKEAVRARQLLEKSYSYFKQHPEALPEELKIDRDGEDRRVLDYIAGMTDQFSQKVGRRLPSSRSTR